MKRWLCIFWPMVRGRRWWLDNLTTGGNTIALGVIAGANAVWGYPLGPLFSAFVVLLLLTGLLNRFYHPSLQISLQCPTEVEQGEAITMVWQLLNARKVSVYDLKIRLCHLPAGLVFHDESLRIDSISSGGTATVSIRAVCSRRGIYEWPTMQLASYFPFGIFRSSQTFQPSGQFAVTPRLIPLRRLLGALPNTTLIGPQLSDQHAGEAFQYLGSREYVPGMHVRRWDFAAWARVGRPILREFESPRSPQLLIWVDAHGELSTNGRSCEPPVDDTLEAVFSLAASLARAAISYGARVRVRISCEFGEADRDLIGIAETNSEIATHDPLVGILRRLAAARANSSDRSERALLAAAQEPSSSDIFLVVTGKRDGSTSSATRLPDGLLSTLNAQTLMVDAAQQITLVKKKNGSGRERKRTGQKSPDAGRANQPETKESV